MKQKWVGDPSIEPREIISLVDVIGTEPGNGINSTRLTLGVAYSGETYTSDSLLFSPSGILSIPLGPGSIANNKFSASNTSVDAAQYLAYKRNDQWICFAGRDGRAQSIPGNLQSGETAIYAPGSLANTTYKLDGSINNNTSDSAGINTTSIVQTPSNVTITAAMTQIGDMTAQALTYGTWSDSLLTTVLVPFAAALQTAAAGGDPLLPILFPNTAAAFTAFAQTVTALAAIPLQTTKVTAK